MTSIGEQAFSKCNVKSVSFKKCASTLTIGWRAFNENRELSAPLVLPEGLISLGECCFLACGLTSVTLPSTLATVSNSAFGGNPSLTTVNFSRGLTTIEEGGFGNTGITALNLPTSLKTIGDYAFNLIKIKDLVLPYGVTSLGARAFYDCPNLVSVNFPASLTSVGAQAFDECRNLEFVSSANPNPPVLGADCFYYYTCQTADLMLSSDAAIDRYKIAPEWEKFSWFSHAGIDDVVSDNDSDSDAPCSVYDVSGTLVTTCQADALTELPHGIYIVRQGESVRKFRR